MPNKSRILRWARKLESGKTKQIRCKLYHGERRCCLGVATDLYIEEVGGKLIGHGIFRDIDGTQYIFNGMMPKPVADYFGLSTNPQISINGVTAAATDWNDVRRKTFKEIAEGLRQSFCKRNR